jgi:hypothetical protein
VTDTCDISVGRRESHAIETKEVPYKYVVTDTCDISVGRRESHAIETKEAPYKYNQLLHCNV